MKVLHAALLEEIVRRIVAALQPETIYLYGLHTYGQPHEDSDVNLLVVLREATRSGHENAVEAYRALRGLCVPAEVKVVTRNEFERRAQWLSSVEKIAKEKGRIVYAASAHVNNASAASYCSSPGTTASRAGGEATDAPLSATGSAGRRAGDFRARCISR